MNETIKALAWKIPKRALLDFIADNSFRFSAALAFYTMLSLAPLTILVLGVTSLFAESDALEAELLLQIRHLIGAEGAQVLATVLSNAERSSDSGAAATFGIIILIFGATAVFAQLQEALNQIWGVEPQPRTEIVSFLLTRLVSFGMVLAVGFLLLASLVVTAAITTVSTQLRFSLPGGQALWEIADVGVTLVVTTFLFSLIFRFVPDVKIAWSDVLVGALITAILFTFGKSLIGFQIGSSSVNSVYGAAGSLVVLLLWIYYTSLTVFFGAELAQVYTRYYGSAIKPRRFGRLVKKDL